MSDRVTFNCTDISVSFGTQFGRHVVLDDLSLDVDRGQRVVLVGENGSGKSTLLRVLAGTLRCDRGQVDRPAGRIAMMTQVPPWSPDTTVEAVMDASIRWATRLTTAVEEAGAALADRPGDPAAERDLSDALAAAEAADAWSADTTRDAAVGHLLPGIDPGLRIGELSGGQVGRLQIVDLLARQPSALLLDEPTNHLDADAVDVLVGHLRGFVGPVVAASHDRQFIEDVATGVLDLDPGRGSPRVVPGGWTAYRAARSLAQEQWREDFAAHRTAEAVVGQRRREAARDRRIPPPRDNDKFIPKAKAQQADRTRAARLRRADVDRARLAADRVPKPPRPLHLRAEVLTAAGPQGVLLSAQRVAVAARLSATRLDVTHGDRILVVGPNGAGKSTLLQVLAGTLAPSSGEVLRQPGVRVGHLDQDPPPMDPNLSPRQWFDGVRRPEATPELVELGLIRPRDLDRPVGELSAGQRRRLALAATIARPPHVLLLDEPTDHLSLSLVEELEAALLSSPGAVVVASHDRWLRSRWDGEVNELAPAHSRPHIS
ncbi:ABC-F family ATP-binding cassette domain-containing protein [Euzebya tangerina]|uniref:ABC-F family ATP-binding cassette domain-containing protein n=1 Tax=Euzebya tangerina TaxID=591198 RepID=UPI000E3150CF|nr:ATP-binding cassette domain-containing protein [Euzebya tangerina]